MRNVPVHFLSMSLNGPLTSQYRTEVSLGTDLFRPIPGRGMHWHIVPATLALFGIGLADLGWSRRKKGVKLLMRTPDDGGFLLSVI